MRKVKRIVLWAFLLIVALSVLLFTIENRQVIELTFLGWSTPSLPLALFVLLVFIAGLIVGYGINWLRSKGLEIKCRQQAKQLEKIKAQS